MSNEIEQLRQELALAKAFGIALYHRAFPTKSPAIVLPARTEMRTPRVACGGREPSTPWRDVPFVVIDTETTGVDPLTDRVVEIALVHSDGRAWSCVVNPGVPIPPGATAVHGIGDADVVAAPSFIEAWETARATGLLDAHPLAYQADFDRSLIVAELVRADAPADSLQAFVDVEWFDAIVAVKDVDKYAKGKKLVDACTRRGIVVDGAHRALADARATLALWRRLESWCDGAPGRGSLAEILRHTKNRRAAQELDYQQYQARQQRGSGRAA